MPGQAENDRIPSGAVAQWWALRNEKFIRAMCMVGAYVFGAIFLVSLLAVGVFTFISVLFAAMFLASLATFFALWTLKRRRP
jgi:hypothetical protein